MIPLIARDMRRSSHIKGPPLLGDMIAPKDLENPKGHVSSLLAWLDRNFWMNRRCSGRQRGAVQKPVTRRVPRRSMMAGFRARLPDAKRPSRGRPCQKSAIRCPTPTAAHISLVSRSWRPGRCQRGGQRHQRRTCAEVHTVNFRKVTSPPATCREGRSEESLLERRAVRTLAARQNPQSALGKFLKFVQKGTVLLVEDVEIDGAWSRIPTIAPLREFSITMVHSFLLQ